MLSGGFMGYYVIAGIIALVSGIVSSRLKSKFNHYSKLHLRWMIMELEMCG